MQSRLLTIGGPRQNLNEGPLIFFLICHPLPFYNLYFLILYSLGNEMYNIFWMMSQAATVDIIDSDAASESRDWYKNLIRKNMIDFGFAGWMAGDNKASPFPISK